ncbi:MAG: hypothetical protein IJE97_10430 [Thermoguttaceae bacterium]|nr:hypothetical protein [Thermoguttaceae bacterium]
MRGGSTDEAAFQTALTTAESCFGGAFAETRDGQTTTALVAAAVSAFYRDDRPRAVHFLKAALGANIFVGDEKRWKNYFRYMVFMTLKREIWSFLASIQACDSLGGYLKKAEQALGERAGSYRKTAKQYSGAQARAWRDAAKRAKQLRRATKKLRRWQRWTWLAPTTVDHVFGRIDKKMRRVYKRIQEPNLATVAADVYFLPIDGAGRPTCWGFFWRFCLCWAIVFATIFAIAAAVDAI